MDELNRLPAERVELAGSALLVLDDPGSLWVIDSGAVALFAVELVGRTPRGPRRYLFGCGAQEALFGLPAGEPTGVIAVALEPTALRRVALDGLAVLAPGAAALAERSIARWAAALALEPAVLPRFQAGLVARLHELRLREQQAEREAIGERERSTRAAAREAIEELAAVLRPQERPLPAGSPLFTAAWAVARAQSIRLKPPVAEDREADGALAQLEAIAGASLVRFRRVLLSDGWWKREAGPLLAFTRQARSPVALLPHPAGGYRLLDPLTRDRRVVDQAVAAALDPEAYVFYRPLPERAGRPLELLGFALHGRQRDLLLGLVTGVAATLLGMFAPQATALVVDRAIVDADSGLLFEIGLGLAAAALGAAVFRLSQGIALLRLETAADAVTQSAVWDRLLNLQLSFFRRFSTGDLQSRVTAISQIRSLVGGSTMRTLFSSVILLLNLGLLVYYSAVLAIVAVVAAALAAVVTVASGIAILRRSRRVLELRGGFFGLMVQLINGVAKLRVAAAEERAFARWAAECAELSRQELGQRRIQDAVQVVNGLVSAASAIVLFALAAGLARSGAGGLTTGEFLAFNVAYGTFIGALVDVSNTVIDVLAVAILSERSRPILEAVPEVSERKVRPGRLSGRLALDHVVFQYQREGPLVLEDASLAVTPGQFVALVGPSGSGKSTLFRLLLGFETPQSGSIQYDGQDLAGLDVYAVRRQMGVVLQNGRINAGSLLENISGGAPVALNDAWEAARATGFAEEIEAMPMGLHTVISEGGTNLSGGQRQRLLLARALVHHPAILLLDEATSALDNRTQAVVSESLQRLQVTRLVIAHRLSTIRRADLIYVLAAGRIVQHGSFDELARQPGLFARLVARQLA